METSFVTKRARLAHRLRLQLPPISRYALASCLSDRRQFYIRGVLHWKEYHEDRISTQPQN
jgi:hypothetical protein